MSNAKNIIIVVLSILLAISLACNLAPKKQETITVEVRDTITIEKERIITHTKPVYITKFDTIVNYVVIRDSVIDTVNVPVEIPITHYEYKDTIRTDSSECMLGIKYSGFKASLDDIGISYRSTREVPVKTKKSGLGQAFGLSINAGYGLTYSDRQVIPGPYVGIGITYTIGYVKLIK